MLQRKTKGDENVLQNLRHRPLQRFRIPKRSNRTRIWDASGDQEDQEDQDQWNQDQGDQDQGDQEDQDDQDQEVQEDASGDASWDLFLDIS